MTHWKRPWCWEGLGAGGEGDNRGWDGWMASLTRWRWVWVNSGSWWWTGRPGMLWFMGPQSLIQLSDWTELKEKIVENILEVLSIGPYRYPLVNLFLIFPSFQRNYHHPVKIFGFNICLKRAACVRRLILNPWLQCLQLSRAFFPFLLTSELPLMLFEC